MNREIVHLDNDIEVICQTARSFPEGVAEAFDSLSKKIPSQEGRTFYGISYGGKDGKIVYKAAVNQVENNEAEKYHCEKFLIRKGNYISETIPDFMQHIPLIGQTFKRLLDEPHVDKVSGYCLEKYLNQKDVQCMVTLEESN